MYLTEIFIIFMAAPVVWFWLESMKIKELARYRAAQLCANNNVQFLDDTVHLSSIRFARGRNRKFRLQRRFAFEFTNQNEQRYNAYVLMFGRQLIETYMDPYPIDEQL